MIETLDLRRQHAELREQIAGALLRVVDSGRYILGDEVAGFEREFAAAHGCAYGIGVNSGTDALRIALRALGVGLGDQVITTASIFVATVGAVVELGSRRRVRACVERHNERLDQDGSQQCQGGTEDQEQ